MACLALIPAAGSGARVAAGAPKQYLRLAGRPMLWHSVRAVCVPPVERVLVVLAPGDEAYAGEDWSAFGDRVAPLWCGGATRRDSVYNGLVSAMADLDPSDWVLVHDAARPCLPAADLGRLVKALADDAVGGILALPVSDTVKRGTAEGRIAATEAREGLWLAQTPQMFRAALLMEALQKAPAGVTDEASAVEALGFQPLLVPGSRANLKVTWPGDVALAEAILSTTGAA